MHGVTKDNFLSCLVTLGICFYRMFVSINHSDKQPVPLLPVFTRSATRCCSVLFRQRPRLHSSAPLQSQLFITVWRSGSRSRSHSGFSAARVGVNRSISSTGRRREASLIGHSCPIRTLTLLLDIFFLGREDWKRWVSRPDQVGNLLDQGSQTQYV